MLDLSGIPLLAAERDETFPLIIGGGPCAYNPEPLADFFDAFLLGDGEEAVLEIADGVSRLEALGAAKGGSPGTACLDRRGLCPLLFRSPL